MLYGYKGLFKNVSIIITNEWLRNSIEYLSLPFYNPRIFLVGMDLEAATTVYTSLDLVCYISRLRLVVLYFLASWTGNF
jgi:hypothetical protein